MRCGRPATAAPLAFGATAARRRRRRPADGRLPATMDDPTRVAGWTLIDPRAAPSDPGVARADDAPHRHQRAARTGCRLRSARSCSNFAAPLSSDGCRQQPPGRRRAERRRQRGRGDVRRRRDPLAAERSRLRGIVDLGRGLSAPRAPSDPPIRVSYMRYVARAAAVRRLVDQPRLRPDEPALPELRLRHSSATSPSWSPTRPTCSGRAARRRARASAAIWSGASTSGVTPPAPRKSVDERVNRDNSQ